jgi:hypothetical protein
VNDCINQCQLSQHLMVSSLGCAVRSGQGDVQGHRAGQVCADGEWKGPPICTYPPLARLCPHIRPNRDAPLYLSTRVSSPSTHPGRPSALPHGRGRPGGGRGSRGRGGLCGSGAHGRPVSVCTTHVLAELLAVCDAWTAALDGSCGDGVILWWGLLHSSCVCVSVCVCVTPWPAITRQVRDDRGGGP